VEKTRIFSILTAVAVLSLAAVPAKAQSFRELMEDIGIQKRKQEKMDFSERAPLVLPPGVESGANLPPPEDPSALASANPNWPRDPDTQAELDAAEADKVPQRFRRKYQEDPAKAIYKIRAQEREQGRQDVKPKAYDTAFDTGVMTPDQLNKARKEREADAANGVPVAIVEPERKRMTDPPPGYRMPSADQAYGPGEKDRESKNWLNRLNPFSSAESR
jgi:type II secretory pathway pseudopilin PulG